MHDIIDTHCHLNHIPPDALGLETQDAIWEHAQRAGVSQCINISVDLSSWPEVVAMAERHSAIKASCGVHPTYEEGQDLDWGQLRAYASHPEVVALGETGLDYFHCQGDLGWQQSRFRKHIRLAHELNLPLVIHSRQAKEDTLQILREEGCPSGVLHCFGEDWEMAEQAMEMGLFISFSGIVTFKNAKNLHEVAERIPLEYALVETDAPYLAPSPHRGSTNHPALVVEVVKTIARMRGVEPDEVAKITTANARRLFALEA